MCTGIKGTPAQQSQLGRQRTNRYATAAQQSTSAATGNLAAGSQQEVIEQQYAGLTASVADGPLLKSLMVNNYPAAAGSTE